MSYETDKQELIKKLTAQNNGIENILNLKRYSVITPEVTEKLTKINEMTKKIIRKLVNNEFEIAVVGLEKAGKSSFCNALIENDMLPTNEKRCTYTSTNIIYSEESRAEVKFFSRDEFEKDLRNKLYILGIPDHDKYSIDSLTKNKYDELYKDVSSDKKELYGNKLNKEIEDMIKYKSELSRYLDREPRIFIGGQANSKEFKDYITEPQKAMAVKEIIISSPRLTKMPNAIIYDVPGFNSPTAMHLIQTKERMNSADAIVMLAAADAPNITAEQLKVMKDYDDDGTRLSEKLFVFANKADRSNKLNENIDIIYGEWGEEHNILHDKSRFFFGSSNAWLKKLGMLNKEDKIDYIGGMNASIGSLKNEFANVKRDSSEEKGFGVVALREALEKYNASERFKALCKRADKLQTELFKQLDELKEKCSDSGDSVEDIGGMTLFANFIDKFRSEITRQLDIYRDEHKNEMITDKLLSKDFVGYISENVLPDKYSDFITDQLESEKVKLPIIAARDNRMMVTDIEGSIRKALFKKMYETDFADNVLQIVSDHHQYSTEKIIGIFLNALGIKEGAKFYRALYSDISEKLKDFIDLDNSRSYYRSLIERYSRDFYELLIGQHYSDDRYTRFLADINNYISMSVYYDPTSAPVERGKVGSTSDNTFCLQMLCHDYTYGKLSEAVEEAKKTVAAKLKTEKLPENLLSLVSSIVRKDIFDAGKAIADVITDIVDEDEINRNASVSEALKRLNTSNFGKDSLFAVDIANESDFREAYHKCFNSSKNYDDVVNEIKVDIDILKDILLNCFVRALALEKPYIAREYLIVEKIKDYVKSPDCTDFVGKNIKKILANDYEKLEIARLEHELNKVCHAEIDKIMETMKTA